MSFKVDIHPHVSTAFVMLHHYFRVHEKPRHPLYIVITCCYLACLKKFEATRTMQAIFTALLEVCRELAERTAFPLRQVLHLSDFANRDLTGDEIMAMNICEMDVLQAHNFQAILSTSFDYTERFVEPSLETFETGAAQSLRDALSKGHCHALLSVHYLDYEPEAIAVAVTRRAFAGQSPLAAVDEWIAGATERLGREAVEAATELLEQQQKVLEHPRKT
jgi:hypothetical protein